VKLEPAGRRETFLDGSSNIINNSWYQTYLLSYNSALMFSKRAAVLAW